ncbi:Asp23/Gls24 family envelope stress response protein [Streptomyces zhihengii]
MTSGNHPPDSPTPDPDDELLPCGRLLSRVWADWEEGTTDDHGRTCPHCRRAAGDLDRLETTVRELRDDTPGTPSYDAALLTRRVMDVVRMELRPGRPLPLGEPDEDLWIMEAPAARVLRTAAEQAPGVRAGSCRIVPASDTATGRVTVRLGVQLPLDAGDLPGLAEQARAHVQRAAERRLGLRIDGIDIHITDLVGGPDDPGGSDVPDRADGPGGHDVPSGPDVPDRPGVPGGPDVPSGPGGPGGHDDPGGSGGPGHPGGTEEEVSDR